MRLQGRCACGKPPDSPSRASSHFRKAERRPVASPPPSRAYPPPRWMRPASRLGKSQQHHCAAQLFPMACWARANGLARGAEGAPAVSHQPSRRQTLTAVPPRRKPPPPQPNRSGLHSREPSETATAGRGGGRDGNSARVTARRGAAPPASWPRRVPSRCDRPPNSRMQSRSSAHSSSLCPASLLSLTPPTPEEGGW